MKARRIRKPRGGVSRSGVRRIDWIMAVSPARKTSPCRREEAGEQ